MGSRLDKNSKNVSRRIEGHTFGDEQGEEYQGSKFGGFSDYMRRKKVKLQNLDAELRSQSTDNPKIFRGIVAHVNGYTQPSLSDLHRLIVAYGGGFLQYLDGKTACTHIIASQLTPKKKAEFAKYRIVKPAWVVDSVKAGKLLPWDNYRVVDEGVTQKVLGFDGSHMVSQTNNKEQSYRGQTDTSWYTSQVKQLAQSIDGASNWSTDSIRSPEIQVSGEDEIVSLENESSRGELHSLHEDEHSDVRRAKDAATPSKRPSLFSDSSTLKKRKASPLDDPESKSSAVTQPVSDMTEKRTLTAEEHNARLLQDPRMAKSSTANPDFINQYYRESRLHHLSHWKAELKAQLQARAIEKSASQKDARKRPSGARRYIMHVDFDSFFAAVSLRKNLHLIDRPVVIAHGSGPGSEIASCNYPARKYGVKNGMWMKSALELCPNLNVLPYDFKAYEEASRHFYDSILSMEGIVQSISIDEALIDVSTQCIRAGGFDGKSVREGSIYREQAKVAELAQELREKVKQKTGCDVSVGIGGNILLAKVALRKAKPANQHLIKPEDVLEFIGELSVTDLPGVAYSLGNKLEEMGVKLVKDIRGLTKERLMSSLGPKTGEKLWDYSRGIDKMEVGDQAVRKSVSAEVNWGIRFVTQQQAEEFVQTLCDELHKRLLENAVKGRQLTMKIMRKSADAGLDPPKNLGHGKCDTFNKSVVLGVSTNDKEVLGKEAISILRGYGFPPGELRGLGVQMQKLEPLKPALTAATTSLPEGSQRRLTFKRPEGAAVAPSPKPEKHFDTSTFTPSKSKEVNDTIEDVPTPEKPKISNVVSGAINDLYQSHEKPLNMLGTQFVVPSQIDPTVLAELPEDIRSKLVPRSESMKNFIARPASPFTDSKSRSASPYPGDFDNGLPSQSQLDPDALAALPDDVREELMAHYRSNNKVATRQAQSLLPQSPRKGRPISKKVNVTPVKKHKISTVLNKRGSKTSRNSNIPTLTQSNFVSMPRNDNIQTDKDDVADPEISKSFLDGLPEDIRVELLAEQKRHRMKARSGLNVGNNRKKQKATNRDEFPRGQQTLQLPARPDKPTFTSRKLSSLSELREAMSAWVQEFSSEGEEGPFEEDVLALATYLSRVVAEERDIEKAVAVIRWLIYLIEDWPFSTSNVHINWQKAIIRLEQHVQDAVVTRGLPPVDFT